MALMRILLLIAVLLCSTAFSDDKMHIANGDVASPGVDIYCFHIHVYFMQGNKASTARALDLRRRFISRFLPENGAPCTHEVTVDRPCVWEHPNMVPAGPHTYGSWGASLPNSYYDRVIPWVIQNQVIINATGVDGGKNQVCEDQHGAIAGILVHPLTADRGKDTRESRKLDHQLVMWTGQGKLPLDFDFLYYNDYDCDTCDPNHCTQACK